VSDSLGELTSLLQLLLRSLLQPLRELLCRRRKIKEEVPVVKKKKENEKRN